MQGKRCRRCRRNVRILCSFTRKGSLDRFAAGIDAVWQRTFAIRSKRLSKHLPWLAPSMPTRHINNAPGIPVQPPRALHQDPHAFRKRRTAARTSVAAACPAIIAARAGVAVACRRTISRRSPPQRAGIEQAVIERRQRLGWIVFVDSIDPDGDTVAVEASGPTQPIVLTKGWTPIAVTLAIGCGSGAPSHQRQSTADVSRCATGCRFRPAQRAPRRWDAHARCRGLLGPRSSGAAPRRGRCRDVTSSQPSRRW